MSTSTFFKSLAQGMNPSLNEAMKYEAIRLASFAKRPAKYSNNPASRLANAGYFYVGPDDSVECFTCGDVVSGWNLPANPYAVHARRRPDCAYVADQKENVSFASQTTEPVNGFALLTKPIDKDFNFDPSKQSDLEIDTALPPLVGQMSMSTAQAPETKVSSRHERLIGGGDSRSLAYLGPCPGAPILYGQKFTANPEVLPTTPSITANIFNGSSSQFTSAPQLPDYKYEEQRRSSFQYWPSTAAMRPEELARAGFYYLGTEDRTQCAFCKGVLRNWTSYDSAIDEHRKHFPSCPFIVDSSRCGNVESAAFSTDGIVMRREIKNNNKNDDYMMGVMSERAYHPSMAVTSERVKTFANFRSESRRSREEFADAGFFFTGQGDNVKCFFCDGGLRNWERNDEPWLEHARWFPKCGYLRTKKGDNYIKEIRKKHGPPGTKKPRIRRLKIRHHVTDDDVNKQMAKQMAKEAYDMGFQKEPIRNVIKRRLGELGSMFPNVESLIDALYEAEEYDNQEELSEDDEDDDDEDEEEQVELAPLCEDETPAPAETPAAAPEKKKKKKKNKKKKQQQQQKELAVDPFEMVADPAVGSSQLKDEVQKMKDERMCKVCMDNEVNIVFLKCGHLVCCSDCAPVLRHCPICRENIRGTIRAFLS